MSATGRVGKRDALDRYYTPDDLAEAIVQKVVLPLVPHHNPDDCGSRVLAVEPHAGGGAFVRALGRAGIETQAYDIDAEACQANGWEHADWLDVPWHESVGRELVVGNPPYRNAEKDIRHAISHAPVVVMLLRLAFLEGQRRRQFWREHRPSKIWVLSKRPSFTGAGVDATAYAVFVWDRRIRQGEPVLNWLDW